MFKIRNTGAKMTKTAFFSALWFIILIFACQVYINMKKLQDIIISTRTMAVLLLVYAFAMAYATFLENDYGTPTAKALIYEAKWFELIMVLLILNFIGNIGRYRLWKKDKWPVLVFHLAFVFIFIGGAITRYISFEGTMHIREGKHPTKL